MCCNRFSRHNSCGYHNHHGHHGNCVEKREINGRYDRQVIRHEDVIRHQHDIINEYDIVHEHDYNYYDVVRNHEVVRCNDFTMNRPLSRAGITPAVGHNEFGCF